MLVLALQFSRDGPIDRQVRAAATRAAAPVNGEMTGTKELELPHNGTGTPGDSGSGGAVQRFFEKKETGSEVIRIAE